MDTGRLIIRIVVGLTLAAHGAQKLFGTFGGRGLDGTGRMFEALGFRPGKLFAGVAGLGETGGGLALAFGLLTPLAAGVVAATMIVAIVSVHLDKGFFTHNGGYEFPLMIGAVALGIALTGPGKLSLDAMLGLSFSGTRWGLLSLAMGVFGALTPLSTRTSSPKQLTRQR
jgi:putative oxidoreductase